MNCTISLHTKEQDSHLDVFFEKEEFLETYNANLEQFLSFNKKNPIELTRTFPHRKIYLDFIGNLSGNRGKIEILWKGKYENEIAEFKKKMYIQKKHDSLIRLYIDSVIIET